MNRRLLGKRALATAAALGVTQLPLPLEAAKPPEPAVDAAMQQRIDELLAPRGRHCLVVPPQAALNYITSENFKPYDYPLLVPRDAPLGRIGITDIYVDRELILAYSSQYSIADYIDTWEKWLLPELAAKAAPDGSWYQEDMIRRGWTLDKSYSVRWLADRYIVYRGDRYVEMIFPDVLRTYSTGDDEAKHKRMALTKLWWATIREDHPDALATQTTRASDTWPTG